MAHALETPLAPLVRDFRAIASRGEAFVLATLLATEGSTYRKAGTQMLIAAGHEPLGLLSGGCLEAAWYDPAACAASLLSDQDSGVRQHAEGT